MLRKLFSNLNGAATSIFASTMKTSAMLSVLPSHLLSLGLNSHPVLFAAATVAASFMLPNAILLPLVAISFIYTPFAFPAAVVKNAPYALAIATIASLIAGVSRKEPAEVDLFHENKASFRVGHDTGAAIYDTVAGALQKSSDTVLWAFGMKPSVKQHKHHVECHSAPRCGGHRPSPVV